MKVTVKKWLKRARVIDKNINSLLKARSEAYDKALIQGVDISLERVQGGKGNSVEDRLLRIAELDREINSQIDALVEAKHEIIRAISKVEDIRYRTLLIDYYVNGNTWEQVAEELGLKDVRWVYTLHGRALKEIGEVLNLS